MSALYADLCELGGFFELTDPGGTDAVPWSDMLAPEPLQARCEVVRARLAASTGLTTREVDPKVAMSALQVGLASRLWSVTVACALSHRWLPDLSSTNLLASPVHAGAAPLAVVDPERGYAVDSPEHAVRILDTTLVRGSLAELEERCSQTGRTARAVLRSNTSSSLVGAARVLASRRPLLGTAAWELARMLLELPELAQGGSVRERATLPTGVGGGMGHTAEAFLRRGCCLFDRLPGHGLCPDCVRAEHRPEQVTSGH